VAALAGGWAVLLVDAVRDLAVNPSFAAVLRLVVEAVAAAVTVVALAQRLRSGRPRPAPEPQRRGPPTPAGGGGAGLGSSRAGSEPAGGDGGQQAQPGHDRQGCQRTG